MFNVQTSSKLILVPLEIPFFTSKLFICLDQDSSILLLQTMNQVFKQHKSPSQWNCRTWRGKVEQTSPKTAVLNLAGALGTTGLSRSGRGVAAHQGPRVTGALPLLFFWAGLAKSLFKRSLCTCSLSTKHGGVLCYHIVISISVHYVAIREKYRCQTNKNPWRISTQNLYDRVDGPNPASQAN